jgi:large exoprotein involved in heme utilization and adhesion
MSSIFQGLLNASGRLKTGVGPIASYFRSLPLNAAGEVVAGSGPITYFEQGIPRNAAGAVVGINATQPTDYGPGALPYGPNGEIVGGGTVPAIAFYHQGVPYDSAGRYCGTTNPGQTVVTADLTITPAVISVSSVGYRLSPLAGALTPTAYAGGTVVLAQATDLDEFRVQNTGSVQFPGIIGNLTVQLPAYLGPNRMVLPWSSTSGWYSVSQPGIYAYITGLIGLPTTMRLSAAPV